MANPTLSQLRSHAIDHSLFTPTTLQATINKLGFVQADPIRSPATAQDLTLRQRVKNYRAGDLERRYAKLDIEEDYLYAYGFLPREIWQLLHPRTATSLPKLEKQVLAIVKDSGEIHPRELEAHFGSDRVINAWGGHSKATTCALDNLHHRGLLRIARREKGIRVYQATPPFTESMSPMDRSRRLIMVLADIFAPAPLKSLTEVIARLRYSANGLSNTRTALTELLNTGALVTATSDGVTYIAPSFAVAAEIEQVVRFLAPFDPLVWDRRRFEHLWGWSYRFEAYTPVSKRVRGYYSMPLLYGSEMIGWANAQVVDHQLKVEPGFVQARPKGAAFSRQLNGEIERLSQFLKLSG